MKMTKMESARIIVEQEGSCVHVECKKCFTTREKCGCKKLITISWTERKLALAEAYIKRHESKSKKKDHIEDKLEKVKSTAVSYEPCVSCRNNHGLCSTKERTANVKNCVSYEPIDIENSYFKKKVEEPKQVGIDNSDVTLVLTAQYEPTPLQIAKMIRDNGYSCIYKNFDDCRVCPFIKLGCGHSNPEHIESFNIRKKLIDDYISANEPCEHLTKGMCANAFEPCDKDCPANSETPKPVKFEDEVPFNLYTVTEYGIFRFTALRFHSEKTKEKDGTTITKEKVFAFEGDRKFDGTKKEVTIDINNCYKTPEEALQVAKKLWNGDGK